MNRKYLLFWLTACLVFALDRITKIWAETSLFLGDSVPGIPGWYEWTLYHNHGAAGGLLHGQVELLVFISVLALTLILWYLYKGNPNANWWIILGLGLMTGGALGNLFDRVFYHYVIDFINPVGRPYIYNIADKGIRWGLYLSLFGLWRTRKLVVNDNQNVVS
jgi:signal peptidase II